MRYVQTINSNTGRIDITFVNTDGLDGVLALWILFMPVMGDM